MKKLIFVFSMSVMLFSCGKNKQDIVITPEKVVKYVVSLEAIYPKDDSIAVIFKTDGYFQYEKAVSLKIKGSDLVQKLNIDMPDGVQVDNVQLTVSTNNNQEKITLKDISILNDNVKLIDVNNLAITDFFDFNPGLALDFKERFCTLNFKGQYPPGITGNKNIEQKLIR